MKKFLIFLAVFAFILVGMAIFKNQILKYIVTKSIVKIVGAPVHMDSFSLNIVSSTILISRFQIHNPDGFPEGILISCPKMNVIYDRAALFKHKLHFLIAEIDIEEFGITKNKEGKLNVDSLKIVQGEAGKGEKQKSKPIPMQIDLLTLSIGKIVHKDYSSGEEPRVTVQEVNVRKTFKNIPTAQQLTLLMLAEPLKAAGIKSAVIYGISMLAGVEVLPIVIAVKFLGKSSVKEILDQSFERLFEVSLEVVTRMGKVTQQDAAKGLIKAKVNGANVTIELERAEAKDKTELKITARKYFLPKPDIAGGVLYQINDELE
jgi:hypothetical protein